MYEKQGITIPETMKKLSNLEFNMSSFLDYVGEELERVSLWNKEDPEDVFMRNQMRQISNHLQSAVDATKYLNKEITAEGELYLNSGGRYEIYEDVYFTSGSLCELLIYDDDYERYSWIKTRIEHNGEDYYAVALGRDVPIKGLKARVRR